MDQYIGKMLDNRYELLELIGTGGMANVYKAKCHRLNRLVAIKILKSELAENAEFRRRFRDESLAVAQLSHANIVSIYDVSSSQGIDYIVMELIDGITLKQYMERRGKMDWREALHFITQIMRGLSHAHSRGIIHRDIKPQNIMVLRDGSVKVADFGIACLADAHQTLAQEALGSVHYISPEQAKGERLDARSDIYSAGVVLYEMLTGRLPFEGNSAVSVAIQHLSSVPLSPRELNPDIPEALELICMKAMNADLNKRYQSADAMLVDLEKFRKDPAIDMDYIRTELADSVDSQPTSQVPVQQVAAAVKKRRAAEETDDDDDDYGDDDDDVGASIFDFIRENKKVIGLFAAGIAAIVLIFVLIFAGFGGEKDTSYKVPNILGYSVEEANQLDGIKDIFTIEVVGTLNDDHYQPGQIVQQDPAADVVRYSNFVIQVYICAERQEIAMPDLLGNVYQTAKMKLQQYDLNLRVDREEAFSDEFPAGQVMATDPVRGTVLKKGDSIMLTVSKGPEKITVPSFVGMTYTKAKEEAEKLGLKVGTPEYRYYDPFASEGDVLEQSISANTQVQGGTEIVFTVYGTPGQQTRSVRVQFLIPDKFSEEDTVRVEFIMDDKVVDTKIVSGSDASVDYDFEGESGTASTVYARINGEATDSQVISF
jgi:serine/threonine protein kinase